METRQTLKDVPAGREAWAQYAALLRQHLYLIGETHQMLLDFGERARAILLKAANDDGTLDGLGLFQAQQELEKDWKRAFRVWNALFQGLRREAASLPFGALAAVHARLFDAARQQVGESAGPRRIIGEQTGGTSGVFEPQLSRVIEAANRRIYRDGLQLSTRLWRLDHESLEGIRRILYEGIARGDSAWNIAKELEQYLGASADCPRWTRTRLYGLTKAEIAAGRRTGLYTGSACAGQGVAYNALRLARNELQIIHNMAVDEALARAPWNLKERIVLSPSHPNIGCACEDIVKGGEGGKGIYPIGTVELPIHPNCMCLKLPVQMREDEFIARLRGWMTGSEAWAEMDEYAAWLGISGADLATVNLAVSIANSLVVWLWGDEAALGAQVRGAIQWMLPQGEGLEGIYM